MALKHVPTDSSNDRQHRTVIATTVNELVKTRPPFDRTEAEVAAGVSPLDTTYAPGDVLRGNAADGANSSDGIQDAIDQAQETSGGAVSIPQGRFVVDAALTADGTLSIYGKGYYSELEVTNAATYLPLLIQNTSAAINGVRLRDFRIDGNAGGQLSAGLIQANNVVGFVFDGLWIENGSRASGTNGVNGIAMSDAGGTGQPAGVIINCTLQANSKAAINISTDCDGVTAAFNRTLNNTGNGTTPGIQLQDSFRSKIFGNTINANQGRGIHSTAVTGTGQTYHLISFNHVYGNGLGTSEGDGIAYANQTGSEVHARAIITENIIQGNGTGLAAGADGIVVIDSKSVDICRNYVTGNKLHGIHLEADNGVDSGHIRVNDNTIDANNTVGNASGAGIFVDGVFDHLEICRNKISNPDAASAHRFGILFTSDCVINDLVMKDNFITEMVTSEYSFAAMTVTRFDIELEGRKQTTDATITTVLSFPIPDNSACFVRFKALGMKDDGSDRAIYEMVALVYRDGAGATIQGGAATNVFTPIESNALWGVALTVSGNNFLARVTGVAATNVNWRWKVEAYSL